MYHQGFSDFHAVFSRRVEVEIRRAGITGPDIEDVAQESWLSFLKWMRRNGHQEPAAHAGMLMDLAKWRATNHFKRSKNEPTLIETPDRVVCCQSAGSLAETNDELQRVPQFFRRLVGVSGGNIMRLLSNAAESRHLTDAAHLYDFVRSYLEHTMGEMERRAISAELLNHLPGRSSLDAGSERLRRSWNQLSSECGVTPLTRARAGPRRKSSKPPGLIKSCVTRQALRLVRLIVWTYKWGGSK